jgi:hypothetical protein
MHVCVCIYMQCMYVYMAYMYMDADHAGRYSGTNSMLYTRKAYECTSIMWCTCAYSVQLLCDVHMYQYYVVYMCIQTRVRVYKCYYVHVYKCTSDIWHTPVIHTYELIFGIHMS